MRQEQPKSFSEMVNIWSKLSIEIVDQVKEGTTITILNALARIQNENLVIDVDKWARINPSTEVKI